MLPRMVVGHQLVSAVAICDAVGRRLGQLPRLRLRQEIVRNQLFPRSINDTARVLIEWAAVHDRDRESQS